MGALLGPMGGLVELHGNASLQVSADSRNTYRRYLSGRVQSQRGPRSRKTWSANIATATPQETALLKQLSALPHTATTAGLVWYDELAQVSNILSEDVSLLMPSHWTGSAGMVGGAGMTADGVLYTRSVTAPPSSTITLGQAGRQVFAVPSQRTIRVNAYGTTYATGTGTLTVEELDPEMAVVASWSSTLAAGRTGNRITRQLTTNVRTVGIRIKLTGFNAVMLPQVTLTDDLMPWSVGLGAQSVAVDITGEDVQRAVKYGSVWDRRSSISYTITELN